ncbi:MAG: glycosyltransferase family 39 protein [Chloroflexi bacterium]|nr:glycosyltransferase family 39 protein [Chloroflexota bacterium]
MRRNRLPALILLVSLAILFALRYCAVMRYLDMGQDIANYLATMDTLFGHDVRGIGLTRPPLIALPLKVFTLAFGDLAGVKVLGVLVSVAVALPLYLLAKRVCEPWIAVIVSVLFVCTPAYATMLGWGYLTMMAILLMLLALHFCLLVLEKPSKKDAVLAGLCASLVVGCHQLTLVFFVALLFFFVVAMLLFNRKALLARWKHLGGAVVVGIVLSLPYLPTYIHLAHMQPRGDVVSLSYSTSLGNVVGYFGGLAWPLAIAVVLGVVAIIALVWLWRRDKSRTLLLGAMLIVSLALLLFPLPLPYTELNRRAQYFLYVPVWILAGVCFSQVWRRHVSGPSGHRASLRRLSLLALVAVFVLGGLVMSQRQLQRSLAYNNYLDDARWEVVNWIGENTASGTVMVASPSPLGWWMEGEAERNTLYLEARDTSPITVERDRSLVADMVLSGNQGIENGRVRLATGYPYASAPGNPAFGAYVGGFYQDLLLFDDRESRIGVSAGSTASLDETEKNMVVEVDESVGQMTTSYSADGYEIVQTSTLRSDEQGVAVRYSINCGAVGVSSFEVPIVFSYEPVSLTFVGERSFEVIQELKTGSTGVVSVGTTITIATEGASLNQISRQGQSAVCSFGNVGNGAIVEFDISLTSPQLREDEPLEYYSVPDLIEGHGLEYVVIDLNPDTAVLNRVPNEIEEWFNSCPYYKLAHSNGDVKVYRVDDSALP